MRNVFAWVLIVLGLILAVGGLGMIVVALMSNAMDVALAGGVWTVLGAIITFVGFRIRVVPPRKFDVAPGIGGHLARFRIYDVDQLGAPDVGAGRGRF
jgi:hypothetical protein